MAVLPVHFQSLKRGTVQRSNPNTRAGSERRTHQAPGTSACLFSLFNGLIGLHSLDKYFPEAGTELVNQSHQEMLREMESDRERETDAETLRSFGDCKTLGYIWDSAFTVFKTPCQHRVYLCMYVCVCV